jgi:hypothetical protein
VIAEENKAIAETAEKKWEADYEASKTKEAEFKTTFDAKKTDYNVAKTAYDNMPAGGTQAEIDAKTVAQTAMNTLKKELQQAQVEADKFKKANEAFKTQQADKDAAAAAEL